MRLIFWNIGPTLTPEKVEYLNKITQYNPDIICIAEGSKSKSDCEKIESVFNTKEKGFKCYYSPLFSKVLPQLAPYSYNPYGLKIFIKETHFPKEDFSFSQQQEEGRIVCIEINQKLIFFLHFLSLINSEMARGTFFAGLATFISSKAIQKPNYEIIIMGDFNNEPWEVTFRYKSKIWSYFHKKEFQYYLNKYPRVYYNPYFEYIQNDKNNFLLGTFYKDSFISLLDYALLSKEIKDYEASIISVIDKTELLVENSNGHEIIHEFDHLPIQLILK